MSLPEEARGDAPRAGALPGAPLSRASCRMFALLDLAFEDSPACPGGGYTSVRGRYTKQHWLLMQQLVEIDAGDPIFYCSDPFELMHKLMTRSAYVLSTKHRKDGQGCRDKGPFGGASESGDRVFTLPYGQGLRVKSSGTEGAMCGSSRLTPRATAAVTMMSSRRTQEGGLAEAPPLSQHHPTTDGPREATAQSARPG